MERKKGPFSALSPPLTDTDRKGVLDWLRRRKPIQPTERKQLEDLTQLLVLRGGE